MGGPSTPSRRRPATCTSWPCLWMLAALAVCSPAAGQDLADHFQRPDLSAGVLLPSDDLLSLQARDILASWTSRASRSHDDSALREELRLASIVKDDNFRYGVGVSKWDSLVVGATTYLVGLGSSSVTIITAKFVAPDVASGPTYSLSNRTIALVINPSAAALFKNWNPVTKELEAVLVLHFVEKGNLVWYRITNSDLIKIGSWSVDRKISALKAFQAKDQMKLLMLTCDTTLELVQCNASADIVDFHLTSSFSAELTQRISLEAEAVSAEISVVGENIHLVLAIPDANRAKLFYYHWPSVEAAKSVNYATYGLFEFVKDFESPKVSHAVFFHVNFRMYMAVGGEKPHLLRFVTPTQAEGCPRALESLGFVSSWLVVPIQTYRDEIVLLAEVEKTINSTLYKSTVTLTWASAGVFKWQLQPPCYIGGEKVSGESCFVGENGESGLKGAIAIQLGDTPVVTVIVPMGVQESALFHIYPILQSVLNPLLAEIDILSKAWNKLKFDIDMQEDEILKTKGMLADSLHPVQPNIISGEWTIEEIESEDPVTQLPPSTSGSDDFKIIELQTALQKLQDSTRHLQNNLLDAAVPQNGEVYLSGNQNLLGGLDVGDKGGVLFHSLSAASLNGESISTLLQDAVRKNSSKVILGTKTITKLNPKNVHFLDINDIPKDDLVFDVSGQTVKVEGNLEVTQFLHVRENVDLPPSGTVGDIDLSEQVFLPGRDYKGMVLFDEVTVEGDLSVDVINKIKMNAPTLKSIASGTHNFGDSEIFDVLDVKGGLQAVWINGFLWSDLVKRIVWRDLPRSIPGETEVTGTFKTDSMEMGQFNGLDFPSEFVLKSSDWQLISGNKTIQNRLLVKTMEVKETVDGVPVKDLVTLRTDQYLNGELKLKEADFVGDMKVDWSVNGIRLDQLHHQSSSIGAGKIISSNVDFSRIVVDGPIQISNTLDNQNFKENILNILVVPDHNQIGTVTLAGKKTVVGNVKVGGVGITVQSDLINGRVISRIANSANSMTFKDTKKIENVVFDNIILTGLWDDVNVVDLNAQAIRLSGFQDTSTRLTVIDPLPQGPRPSKLWASHLAIISQINDMMAGSFVKPGQNDACDYISGDLCTIKGSVNVASIKVGKNVSVDGKVCGWSLHDFNQRRMSISRPQTIHGRLKIENATVMSLSQLAVINEIPISTIPVPSPSASPFVWTKVPSSGLTVDDMHIEGNIVTRGKVNNVDIADIAKKVVKLNGNNIFMESLVFMDDLTINSLEVVGRINQVNVTEMFEDAVLKYESAAISGRKEFMAGFEVKGLIRTRNLNNALDPFKIITKGYPAAVSGLLQVRGNVYAGNVNLTGLLNNIPIEKFQKRHKMQSGRHFLSGDVTLDGATVEELFIKDLVQGVKWDEFFGSVVMKSEPSRITGHKIFVNKAVFQNVEVMGLVNDLKLKDDVQDVVLCNDSNPAIIKGHITFSNHEVKALHGVSLSGNLTASTLDTCDVQEWLANAVYLARPGQMVAGLKVFSSMSSSSDVKLSRINAVDLSKVITLHQPQDIPQKVRILAFTLRHNLEVGGRVNGKDLQAEYDNTLMTTGDQVVYGRKTFINDVTVKNNVLVRGLISNKNITNVVTLQNDETLYGPLKFSNMVLGGDLSVAGHISGIDVKEWEERAFLRDGPQFQTVKGSWAVKGEVKFMKSVGGRGLLDGESVKELSESVYTSKQLTRKMQELVKADWVQLCHDTDALREKARAQPFLFQQLEVVQSIKSSQMIASMHAFEALNEQFLAVSFSNNCSGALYKWNGQNTGWILLDGSVQNIGNVQRWATVRNAGSTYLVTSSVDPQNCPYTGGNFWHFGGSSNLIKIKSVESWHDVQVDEPTGQVHLLGRSGVQTWQLENGEILNKSLRVFPTAGQSQFVPRNAGFGLSTSDGKVILKWDDSANPVSGSISTSSNPNLPARDKGNIASMIIGDGRKLVAVTADASDMLVVYEDVASGHPLARVNVRGARSLSVLELTAPGRTGQTLLAFVEDERLLRVVQYKGVEGFVDVTSSKLPFPIKEMVPVRLFTRGLVNQRHFLLLRSDYQVLLIEVEMAGDPLDDLPLQCVLH